MSQREPIEKDWTLETTTEEFILEHRTFCLSFFFPLLEAADTLSEAVVIERWQFAINQMPELEGLVHVDLSKAARVLLGEYENREVAPDSIDLGLPF